MNQSSSEYYKKATELKNKEKYDDAIKCIRKGIEIDLKNGMLVLADTYLRIPMYYSYNNKITEAFLEIDKIEKNSILLCDLSKTHDAKRKIYQSINNSELSIINGVKSYLYEYCHCFSDFFNGIGQNKLFFNDGVIDQKVFDERNKKFKEFGQHCADNYFNDDNLNKMIKNITKKAIITSDKKELLKKYIVEKLKLKEQIKFEIIENELKELMR